MSVIELLSNIEKLGSMQGHPVTVVAVSKGRSVADMAKLYQLGIRDFAENRVQEAEEKRGKLPADIRWHFIGKIQLNKIAKLVGYFHLIHSVDRPIVAEKISKLSREKGIKSSILLQVNTSGESSKGGLSADEWQAHFPSLLDLPSISIEGLMTMAPLTEDEEVIRQTFSKLREFKERLEKQVSALLAILSMGMSHDYKIAIEEGATLVRIGTALFNELS